ncbi:unnamed protein product [Haemonchus placei]|uniref:Radical SAM protein n=1 Tax=Haemonchus placei TaxID=6290 RepID=A0A0N4WNK8_HAEPC|nr:unnamed protein product [Haemonchus placei]
MYKSIRIDTTELCFGSCVPCSTVRERGPREQWKWWTGSLRKRSREGVAP